MEMAFQGIFFVITALAVWLFSKRLAHLRKLILMGKDWEPEGNRSERWRNLVMLALGQKKMFRNPLVAVMHLIIYAGFIIINIEVLEIMIDGIAGTHRVFLPLLGNFYGFLINSFEILAALVIVVCVIFLARRNIIKLKRFVSHDLEGWPRTDANFILITEIILMSLFIFMNACDRTLQTYHVEGYHETGRFLISDQLIGWIKNMSEINIMTIERFCWWLHIIGIFAFLNYLPYSKHLHILFAFPNAYFARKKPMGEMVNMPHVQQEVVYMMQPELAPTTASAPLQFGAKDATDLSWKNLLDAFSCTECGRCSTACPANQTGKKLSPRKIMMDTRDRMEEIGRNLKKDGSFEPDGKTLLHDYITVEELRACTTCNACVQECPVSISPLEIIVELRRSLVMEESNAPQEWNGMFGNIENNFAPWKLSPDDRDGWTQH
jgi:heterodisulfide reductase subunit C